MDQFTFYKNYYYLIDLLDEKRQQIISLAIIKYMFDDIEPNFEDDKLNKLWCNIKMPLDTSKKQARNRKTKDKPERNQKETKKKPNENQKETKKKQIIFSYFLFLISYFLKIRNC